MSVFIYFFITPSLLSENVVAMSFFCNTHYVGPVPFSRDWIWNCCCCRRGLLWASERVSFPPSPSPTLLAEWMNDTFGPGSDWCLVMMMVVVVILVSMNVKSPPPFQKSHRRKRTRSFEDDEDGHLIYHNGQVLRARCTEHVSFSVCLVFGRWGFFYYYLFIVLFFCFFIY